VGAYQGSVTAEDRSLDCRHYAGVGYRVWNQRVTAAPEEKKGGSEEEEGECGRKCRAVH
jgi:hypothetical protein